MKTKIFIMVLVLALAFSNVVSAASSVTSNGVGTVAEEVPQDQAEVMAVNVGDTITINVENATGEITVISYKGSTVDPANVQYLNQYPSDTSVITYIIRDMDNTQNGLYRLVINDGTNVSNLYYKVGRPVFVKGEDNSVNYFKKIDFGGEGQHTTSEAFMNTTSIAYLASFTPAGGTVDRYGFSVKKNESSTESAQVYIDGEISGEAAFEFGVTIYNLKADGNKTVSDIINDLVVLPYVSYVTE